MIRLPPPTGGTTGLKYQPGPGNGGRAFFSDRAQQGCSINVR